MHVISVNVRWVEKEKLTETRKRRRSNDPEFSDQGDESLASGWDRSVRTKIHVELHDPDNLLDFITEIKTVDLASVMAEEMAKKEGELPLTHGEVPEESKAPAL